MKKTPFCPPNQGEFKNLRVKTNNVGVNCRGKDCDRIQHGRPLPTQSMRHRQTSQKSIPSTVIVRCCSPMITLATARFGGQSSHAHRSRISSSRSWFYFIEIFDEFRPKRLLRWPPSNPLSEHRPGVKYRWPPSLKPYPRNHCDTYTRLKCEDGDRNSMPQTNGLQDRPFLEWD